MSQRQIPQCPHFNHLEIREREDSDECVLICSKCDEEILGLANMELAKAALQRLNQKQAESKTPGKLKPKKK